MGGHPGRQLRLRLGSGVVEGGALLGDVAEGLGVGVDGRSPEVTRRVRLGVDALTVGVDPGLRAGSGLHRVRLLQAADPRGAEDAVRGVPAPGLGGRGGHRVAATEDVAGLRGGEGDQAARKPPLAVGPDRDAAGIRVDADHLAPGALRRDHAARTGRAVLAQQRVALAIDPRSARDVLGDEAHPVAGGVLELAALHAGRAQPAHLLHRSPRLRVEVVGDVVEVAEEDVLPG